MPAEGRLLTANPLLVPDCGRLTHPGWADVVVALEAEASSAYILAPDLSLLHVNTAWQRFARENGAPELAEGWRHLGPVVSHLTPPLQQFITNRLKGALSRNSAWSHTYECSSATVYRRFHMRARPGPAAEALVVVHSLVTESHLLTERPLLARRYTDERGLIVRCAACGRTSRPGQPDIWEWVPGLELEPNVSTGICAICGVQEYGVNRQSP